MKDILETCNSLLVGVLSQALPTMHKQAGENVMACLKKRYPGHEFELSLSVRMRRSLFTRNPMVEFRITKIKGFKNEPDKSKDN